MLASRFASRSPVLRSDFPLSDDQIHRVAPSIFAEAPHESRSQRYAYIPTATVLTELRKEGFQPFMVTQTRTRHEDRRDYTKHMIRLRHASQINARGEANEIILLNSHDGTSSYQMLAGMFRFVCSNGLVCGDTVADVRVPHKGDVAGQVIEGAYQVLHGFDRALESLFPKLGQHRGGRDVAVPLGTALMRGIRKDGRGHAPDLVIRQGVIGTQRRGMGSKTGCKHVFLLTWLLKKTAHRIPRFGAQPFGCSVRSARGTWLALLPPSFLSSSPATVRSARTGAVKEASAGLVRPAAQRGHGPARLDGARERATVADKVMSQGRRLDKATAPQHADRTASEARRPEAGSRAGGVSRTE